jgi:cysteine synthase B
MSSSPITAVPEQKASPAPPRVFEPFGLGRVGNTPLIRIEPWTSVRPGVEVWAKAEWYNPGGSVKDRPALSMLDAGGRDGKLVPGKVILDSTSGNTGIAMALYGQLKGYRVELAIPDSASEERKKLALALGATLHITDPMEGSDGAAELAHRLRDEDPDKYFMPDQYNNANNPLAHYETTGPEVWRQTEGRVTHFVAGIGTGGTIMGTGRRLREYSPQVQIIAVEPEHAFHGLEGLKHMATSMVPGIYDESFPDRKISAPSEAAYETVRALAWEAGLLVGQSSGAAVWAALQVAKELDEGVVVTILPDNGEKYLSTRLWEGVPGVGTTAKAY